MKKLSTIFAVLAILLSDVMCAVVAYNYCALEWGGKYEAWSAPASTALLLAIPYAIGIIICVVLAIVFKRKYINKFYIAVMHYGVWLLIFCERSRCK